MEIIVLPSPTDVGVLAARKIAQRVARKPAAVLGLATGSSPLAIYAELARAVQDGSLDTRLVGAFALDEYVGLPAEHPQSYASVIRREVVEPLRLDPARVFVPDGRAEDLEEACAAYEAAITGYGGVDIQILGIGANGHIGFNEPTSSLRSRTRLKTLALQTRSDNARFFADPDQVPTHCVTQGLGTIMDAREVLLVAQGAGKAEAIAAAVEGPVTSFCPGSVLQFHPRATVLLDEAAAGQLRLVDYYRHTYANKPPWQRF